jgi:CRP-like cAMP-binding protein
VNEPEVDAGPTCFREPEARALLEAGQPKEMPALSLLCQEGQSTDRFFLVTTGEFEVGKEIAGRHCTLSTVGPGSVLGLMPALDGSPCAVSIRALCSATVVEITRENLLAMFDHDRRADLNAANHLSLMAIRRLRGATTELAQALHQALTSPGQRGRIDTARLAHIQAGSYAWID